jgi:hypothetical protein
MKRLLLISMALMLSHPGVALSQTKAKTQPEQTPAQTQPSGQKVEKQQAPAQGQAGKKPAVMGCPMMMTGKMPPEMEKKMKEHVAQMMKGPLEQMQKQIDALRQQVEALEKKK